MASLFVFAARIDGGSDAVLTLHDTYEGAVSSLLREGARLYRARFGYVPSDLSPASAAALADLPTVVAHRISQAEDRLLGGGWVARIDELPLELGSSAAVSA